MRSSHPTFPSTPRIRAKAVCSAPLLLLPFSQLLPRFDNGMQTSAHIEDTPKRRNGKKGTTDHSVRKFTLFFFFRVLSFRRLLPGVSLHARVLFCVFVSVSCWSLLVFVL